MVVIFYSILVNDNLAYDNKIYHSLFHNAHELAIPNLIYIFHNYDQYKILVFVLIVHIIYYILLELIYNGYYKNILRNDIIYYMTLLLFEIFTMKYLPLCI